VLQNGFQLRTTSFTTARSLAGIGLILGALEDNDDGDDTATGNCEWVLSIRDKPKLNSLAFKPAVATSMPLRALIRARAKTGWEKMLLMLMQQHFSHVVAFIRSKLLAAKETEVPFAGVVVAVVVAVATARCAWVATSTELNPN
jgi:hypothetical protein